MESDLHTRAFSPFEPRASFNKSWFDPHFLHPPSLARSWSYIRMSQTVGFDHHDFRAVCRVHETCTLSKSGRISRPLGFLWAWLDFAQSPECLGRATHRAFQPSYQQRMVARSELLCIEGSADFFAAERDMRDGEGDEPDRCGD